MPDDDQVDLQRNGEAGDLQQGHPTLRQRDNAERDSCSTVGSTQALPLADDGLICIIYHSVTYISKLSRCRLDRIAVTGRWRCEVIVQFNRPAVSAPVAHWLSRRAGALRAQPRRDVRLGPSSDVRGPWFLQFSRPAIRLHPCMTK